MIDYILGLVFISISLMSLSITVKNLIDAIFTIKSYTTKQEYDESYPAIEESEKEDSFPRWNVEEFRERMKNIKIDENGLFDINVKENIEEDAGTEIITDSYENEIERKFI